ncbi:hypothetical protein ASF49_13630 [Methylobacterium sp. Leaf104]|nr:hypothetical protein ASF49_13630 [Methylobacterium sp. Leaf104]
MLGMVLVSASVAALEDRGRAAFVEAHRCAVVERLSSIHLLGPRSTSRERFLAVSLAQTDDHYVQCIFFDDDRKMYCEASSGAYARGAEMPGPLLPEPARAALYRLGFVEVNRNENYQREIELGTPPDFDAVADLMIGALYDAYRARETTPLKFNAPRAILSRNACPGPVS